jgi:hypothetical protein
MTPHGFINDDDKAIKNYKNQYGDEWAKILGGGDFKIIEENEEVADTSFYVNEPE